MSEPKRDTCCPNCGKPIPPDAARFRPFCSDRCRLIDLGDGLGDRYRVPDPDGELDDEEDVG